MRDGAFERQIGGVGSWVIKDISWRDERDKNGRREKAAERIQRLLTGKRMLLQPTVYCQHFSSCHRFTKICFYTLCHFLALAVTFGAHQVKTCWGKQTDNKQTRRLLK